LRHFYDWVLYNTSGGVFWGGCIRAGIGSSVAICRRALIDFISSTLFYHDLKNGPGISASSSLSQGRDECLAHFFCWEYDLEPVLKSRALGRFMDSFAHTFTFNTQHDTTPLSGLGKLERCCASTTRCLVVDETVSTAWTGLCYDSTLYYQICTFNWWRR
jgi:hypothetical protein